jgi:hypothetical protein
MESSESVAELIIRIAIFTLELVIVRCVMRDSCTKAWGTDILNRNNLLGGLDMKEIIRAVVGKLLRRRDRKILDRAATILKSSDLHDLYFVQQLTPEEINHLMALKREGGT